MFNTALVSDRYGLSYRQTAAIASAVLTDVGLISSTDTSFVIDKSKIQRVKTVVRDSHVSPADGFTKNTLLGLYFDGRKDKTCTQVKGGAKYYRRIHTEEHISLVQEPGSCYIGHVTPASGTAIDISKCILNFLDENEARQFLVAVRCDGFSIHPNAHPSMVY